jgi:hypothetical protein
MNEASKKPSRGNFGVVFPPSNLRTIYKRKTCLQFTMLAESSKSDALIIGAKIFWLFIGERSFKLNTELKHF